MSSTTLILWNAFLLAISQIVIIRVASGAVRSGRRMPDIQQIRKDAQWVAENHTSMAGDSAAWLIYFIDHPYEFAKALGQRMVPKPELRDKGVPQWRPWA